MKRLFCARVAAMLAVVLLLASCGKDDLNSLVDQAKQQAMAGGEAVAKSVDQSLDQAAERPTQATGGRIRHIGQQAQQCDTDPAGPVARMVEIHCGPMRRLQAALPMRRPAERRRARKVPPR